MKFVPALLALLIFFLPGLATASTIPAAAYISIRTDNLPGAGTASDPFDGSTQVKFDALMNSFPANTQIHLGAGTFMTMGYGGFSMRAGWNIQGQGMGVTVLKLVPSAKEPSYRKYYHLCGFQCDGAQVSNLTCDGNYQGYHWPAHDAVGGVCPFGNNVVIDGVEFINCYGDGVDSLEQFCVCIGGTDLQHIVIGGVVRNCLIHRYAPGANYTNGVMISYSTAGVIDNCTDDGSHHAFGFSGETGGTLENCTATALSDIAFYTDTSTDAQITIKDNDLASLIPIWFNSQGGVSQVSILDNALSSAAGIGAAVFLNGSGGSDFQITGNVYTNTGTGGNGFITIMTTSNYSDLDVEDNSSNVGLAGSYGAGRSMTGAITTLADNQFGLPIASLEPPKVGSSVSTQIAVASTTPASNTSSSPSSTPEASASDSSVAASTPPIIPPAQPETTTSPTSSPAVSSPAVSGPTSADTASSPASNAPAPSSTAVAKSPTQPESVEQLANQVQADTNALVEQKSVGLAPARPIAATNHGRPSPMGHAVVQPRPVSRFAPSDAANGVINTIIQTVITIYLHNGAAPAAAYVHSMPDGIVKLRATNVLMEKWSADEPIEAAEWLAQQRQPAGHGASLALLN